MKKQLFLLLALAFSMISCGSTTGKKSETAKTQQTEQTQATEVKSTAESGLKVVVLHTNKRCITCRAIEELTRQAVAELNDENLDLEVVNISESENEHIADKYEATWSSLILDNGASVNNLTKMAFANARTNPDQFKATLKSEIAKMVK